MAISSIAITSCGLKYIAEPAAEIDSSGSFEVPVTDVTVDPDVILSSHNSVRQRLGVPPLRWSSRLEAYAAQWANYLSSEGSCQIRRRGLIGLQSHKNGIGENLQLIPPVRFDDGRVNPAAVDENKIVLDWVRQGIDFNYNDNKCALNKTCENYTQVVWRDSKVVGCAAASCADKSQIWVCNYDPPGNYLGQKPY